MEEYTPLREQVLASIKTGEAKMTPKWHFILKASFFLSACFLIFFLLIYLLSLAVFVLDQKNLWFVPSFGLRGVLLFVLSLPWLLIFLVIIFLLLLQILVRRYSFAYSRPLFFSALAVLVIVVLGSIMVRQSGFHRVPFAKSMYLHFAPQHINHIFPGTILEFREKDFFLKSRAQQIFEVHVSPKTNIPGKILFQVGDEVIVIGDRHENRIEAEGVRPLPQSRGMHRTVYFEEIEE
ncbi:MAG: hypothetical protein A3B90_03150 [Candidatus Magasanikbacteria bacterium RIFCSPHIGHO2_02_FULL_41_13]|uniref:Uncharacterized protein n=1 Tax=Candidatus Magasanikbacteria bacterium RIFCSPHIGHO2_02_FULL_41_13 TaxID=1798676 RepID=A0A1F6M2J3_9BACT|nr:MAG: hypothetical protein A3B90_03150 [Candidatus Magasanikbacteria bacterium RIFCSPHIGHO2_02_FULL_41_13]